MIDVIELVAIAGGLLFLALVVYACDRYERRQGCGKKNLF